MHVAVIGSGVAGLAAARALTSAGHEVTIYEAADRPGGHVYTVDVDGVSVDMGFIVCNRDNYPLFCGLLDELGIATRPTTMAFSVVDGDLEWGSESLTSMFADRRRLRDVRHWRFLAEVMRFLARARRDLGSELVARATLDEYLAARRCSRELRERFVIPLAAALWSLGTAQCGDFPSLTYLAFLEQHGMLAPIRPLRWHTVVGGSSGYVDALLAQLHATGRFTLRLAMPVRRITRRRDGVSLLADADPAWVALGRDGMISPDHHATFDRVIVATHANTALALLEAPTADEQRVLGAFRYSRNRTVLHTDRSFLPSHPTAHAAWNYVADPDTARVAVTYSMTRLQGLPDAPYLVTLNPRREPARKLHEVTFEHPVFDRAALAAQAELPRLGGTQRTYYAGAHFGFGFHEDGMRAGLAAAARALVDEAGVGRASTAAGPVDSKAGPRA